MLRSHTRFYTSETGLRQPPLWSLFRHFRRENLAVVPKMVCYRPPSRRRLHGNKRQKYKRGAKGRDPKIKNMREAVPPAEDEIFGGKNEISSRTGRDRPGPHGDRNPTTMSFPRRTSGGGVEGVSVTVIFSSFWAGKFYGYAKKVHHRVVGLSPSNTRQKYQRGAKGRHTKMMEKLLYCVKCPI